MDKGKGYRDQFYHEQNIQLRKELRQLDFKLAQGESSMSHCNFLVVGPPKSGKTSLLKTLQYALNGSQGWGLGKRGVLNTVQIKKESRWQIEGVKQLRQVNQKYSMLGMQLSSDEKPSLKYKRALEYVECSLGSCMQEYELNSSSKARVCLIVLDSATETPAEEMSYLKFLRINMLERGVKTVLLLRGTFNRHGDSWKRIEAMIAHLQSELEIKRDDIICMDTILFEEEAKSTARIICKQSQVTTKRVENSEETNFYALQLLLKIVRESEKTIKSRAIRPKGWLCGWT